MNKAKELEKAVAALPNAELREFRDWFAAFDAENWDQQLEADIGSGKLDSLGAEALRRHRTLSG